MIKRLRRRLTALLTVMTALVLAGALFVTWRLSERQYQSSAEQLFETNFSSLCDRLTDAASITDDWLAEQERGTGCFLILQDNGASLHYSGILGSKTPRAELEERALSSARLMLDFSQRDSQGAIVNQEAHFILEGNFHDTYNAAAALLPRGNNGAYLLILSLQDTEFLTTHFYQSALQYTGLWLAGCLLLAVISHWLTGKALALTAQALRQQKEFIAAASHELRSPLTVIRTSAQAIDENPSLEQQNILLHNIQSEADRMTHLTDDLLLLANGDLNNLPAQLQSVAPDNICLEIYDQFYPLAKQAGHLLTLQLPETPLPEIQADEERIRQLLSILLRNAIEHTPQGTSVELILDGGTNKRPITVSVVDHGPGIPDSAKAHIFDRFYRIDASRTSKKNFGLGLSVARELARIHRASLIVRDTPGGGATFVLQFPHS